MNELILRASPLVAVDDAAAAGAKASGAGGTGCMPAVHAAALSLPTTKRAVLATVSKVNIVGHP